MLTLLVMLKLWAEVALLAMLGQRLLALLAGERAQGNLAFELLRVVSSPAVRLVAWLSPSRLNARHHTTIAAVALVLLWLAATVGKVWVCLSLGPSQCR